MTSTGGYTMGICVLLGNKEDSVGKKTYSCLEKVQEFRLSATLLGDYPRSGRNRSLTVIRLIFELQYNMLGNLATYTVSAGEQPIPKRSKFSRAVSIGSHSR